MFVSATCVSHLALHMHRVEANTRTTAQGGIDSSDPSILSAALRETSEELSPNLDVFTPSTVPIASYSYAPKKGQATKVRLAFLL